MRKDDHQLISEYFVGIFKKGVKYDSEKTGLGWATAATVQAKDIEQPTTCKMTAAARARSRRSRHAGRSARQPMELFLVSLLNGLVYGMLLFMLASGLTLIFSMMGVLNFAHASFYMLGAYFAYTISRLRRLLAGAGPGARCCAALLGAAIEMYGLRRVHKHGHVAELLFTFGLASDHREGGAADLGPAAGALPRAGRCSTSRCSRSTARSFPASRGFMMLVSLLMFGAIWLLLTRTRIGLVIQAALTHPDMVEALGHNVPRVFMHGVRRRRRARRAWPA